LRFAFLEGGVGWASQLFGDLIEHWERRSAKALCAAARPQALRRALPVRPQQARPRPPTERGGEYDRPARLVIFAFPPPWCWSFLLPRNLTSCAGAEDDGKSVRSQPDKRAPVLRPARLASPRAAQTRSRAAASGIR